MARSRSKGESTTPMTLGQALAARVRLIVWCKACGHRAEPDVADQAAAIWRRYREGGGDCCLVAFRGMMDGERHEQIGPSDLLLTNSAEVLEKLSVYALILHLVTRP